MPGAVDNVERVRILGPAIAAAWEGREGLSDACSALAHEGADAAAEDQGDPLKS
jgi:hypothetical protein